MFVLPQSLTLMLVDCSFSTRVPARGRALPGASNESKNLTVCQIPRTSSGVLFRVCHQRTFSITSHRRKSCQKDRRFSSGSGSVPPKG